MKTLMRIVAAALLVAAFALSSQAGDKNMPDVPYNRELAETNLMIGLASDNLGLRASSASILAEVGTERSVIPLMQMLHNGVEEERIVAALALSRIGDGRGVYAVRRAVEFDPSPKVQRLAAWYYMEYAVPKLNASAVAEAVAALRFESPAPTPYAEFTETTYDEYQGSGAAGTGD
jgi:HEAT repeat protein